MSQPQWVAQPTAIPGLGGLDDDELLAELEEMEAAEQQRGLDESLLDVSKVGAQQPGPSSVYPSPPARSKQEEEEARDLAEIEALQASMRVEVPMPMPMHAMAFAMAVPVA